MSIYAAHRRCNYRRISARFTHARHALSAESPARQRDACKLYFCRVIGVRACHLSSVYILYILKYLPIGIPAFRVRATKYIGAACCPAASYRMFQMCVIVSVIYTVQNTFVSTYDDVCYVFIYWQNDSVEFKISFSFGPATMS